MTELDFGKQCGNRAYRLQYIYTFLHKATAEILFYQLLL